MRRRSSPRPWGCFSLSERRREFAGVFPTPVGVFLTLALGHARHGLPHARGGVSFWRVYAAAGSSPRPWGCFWSSFLAILTHRLPHARGGVSELDSLPAPYRSSPRPWGCFLEMPQGSIPVFPTPVGVFPQMTVQAAYLRLPHARGGVSLIGKSYAVFAGLPHARGGVSLRNERNGKLLVFPTPVGVFLITLLRARLVFPTPVGVFLCSASRRHTIGLPHARGGVSSHCGSYA